MPRLDGDSLNNLCNALNKLAQDADEEVTPLTLISYVRDPRPLEPPTKNHSGTRLGQTKADQSNHLNEGVRNFVGLVLPFHKRSA